MRLFYSTWREVEEYLKDNNGVIIPIGSVEQHGPTGIFGTDSLCAEGIAWAVGEKTGALVSATINVGMSVHHTAFPGSLSLRPSTLMQVIQDHVFCLAGYGLQRFYFANGHGGNVASLNAAFWEMYSLLPRMGLPHAEAVRFKHESWYELKEVSELSGKLYGDKVGAHATPPEIAVAMHLHPSLPEAAEELPAVPKTWGAFYGAADFRRSSPDGRLGSDPSLARKEHGRRIFETAVDAMARSYREFVQQG
jgi:creatinine amidohydrolase